TRPVQLTQPLHRFSFPHRRVKRIQHHRFMYHHSRRNPPVLRRCTKALLITLLFLAVSWTVIVRNNNPVIHRVQRQTPVIATPHYVRIGRKRVPYLLLRTVVVVAYVPALIGCYFVPALALLGY